MHLILLIYGCANGDRKNNDDIFVFKNVNVIDAVNGLRNDQSVIVRNNKIVEVGFAGNIREPSGATIVECNGKYMIPGLWDAHLHILDGKELTPDLMFPLFIATGITYIRDTSGDLELLLSWRKKASKMEGMAPRVFITGPHFDGLQTSWDHSISIVSPELVKPALDSLIDAEVDHIKIYELPSPEVFKKIVKLAKDKGYKVSAHVPLTMDVIEASNAGLNSMEHMRNLELSISSDWDSLLQMRKKIIANSPDKSGRELRSQIYRAQRLHAIHTQDIKRREIVLKCLADNNTWQVPTLTLTASAKHRMYASEDYRESFRYLPKSTRNEWMRSTILKANQLPTAEELALSEWAYDIIPKLVEAGIEIMAGTDMPLAQLTPGFSLHEELTFLVDAGLTPMQALESATVLPAKFFGLENQQGCIDKNMLADFVILDANPLDNIKNTQKIQAVMRNGYLHTREDLDKMLNELTR